MFYGWVMVAVAFVTQFISSGVIFYTFGIALKEWTVEFDAGRLGVSGIHFVMPWAGAAIAPFVGRLAEDAVVKRALSLDVSNLWFRRTRIAAALPRFLYTTQNSKNQRHCPPDRGAAAVSALLKHLITRGFCVN